MQAPTDNLYKFVAISGLISFLYFQYDFDKRKENLLRQIDDYNMQAAVLLATIENHTATFDAMVARSKLVVSDPPKLEELLAAYDKNDALTEKFNEKRVDLAKLTEADKVIARSRAQLISLGERYPLFSGISFGLFGLGLCLWYQRTQKHLDRKDRQGDGCSSPARFKVRRRGRIRTPD
jgi:hypothetical protein